MKILLSTIFLISTSVVFPQDDATVQTLTGTLAPGAERTFGFPAKKGQSVNARITSDDGNVIINEEEGATDLTFEAAEGRNTVTIINRGEAPDRYELVIKVFTPEPEPAEEIKFSKCERKKTVPLTMYPYKFKRRFEVKVDAGDRMIVAVFPKEARDRLKFTLLTDPQWDDTWQDPDASLILFAHMLRDYIFEIKKGDEELLEAQMTIEIDGKFPGCPK